MELGGLQLIRHLEMLTDCITLFMSPLKIECLVLPAFV